jgi:hypothetical protein
MFDGVSQACMTAPEDKCGTTSSFHSNRLIVGYDILDKFAVFLAQMDWIAGVSPRNLTFRFSIENRSTGTLQFGFLIRTRLEERRSTLQRQLLIRIRLFLATVFR